MVFQAPATIAPASAADGSTNGTGKPDPTREYLYQGLDIGC